LLGAAALLALGNAASRVLGLVREQTIAYYFGGTLKTDAFVAASRVPTMLYDLLVGGQLTAALVPVLSSYVATRRDELWRAASVLFTAAAVVTGLATLAVYLLAAPIAQVLGEMPAGMAIIEQSLRIIAPSVLIFGLAGMSTALIYALERFSYAAAAAAIYNAAFIVTLVAFQDRLDVYALPLGVTLGGLAQLVLLGVGLRDARLRVVLALRHPVLLRVIKLYLPIGLGLLVAQLQVIAATRLAAKAGVGVLASLNYADRLIQFPQGFVAVAISLAILPTLAAAHARLDTDLFNRALARGLRLVLTLVLPAVAGLAVLATPVVGAVYQRGAFVDLTRLAVTLALLGYLIGLPFAALDLSLNNAFYARQNTLTPSLVGILSVGVYLVVAVMWGPVYNLGRLADDRLIIGLALADSAKHISHAAIMLALVRSVAGRAALEGLGRTAAAATLAAALMALVVAGLDHLLAPLVDAGTAGWLLRATAGTVVGLLVYLPLAARLGVDEVRWIAELARDRLRGGSELPVPPNAG
jgi:putative peptidoglycan lipid II flippase